MRSKALQYLYLQKPISTIIIICAISVLPWIGLSDFSTKGEPREAAVAVSMIESGDWILPKVYANEFAYKPPMAHWLMAIFSLPQGHVSEFTARLPSALAYIVMLVFIFVFFGKKTRFQEAFIATLLLLTCIEIHRAGLTTRVDMLLTAFIVIGLILLYRWEDLYELKGIPISIPLVLSGAVLTKGPVGLILPMFVFSIYLLLLKKYNFVKIIKSVTYIGITSLFIPAIWYLEAWKRGGDEFLNVILAENFGRFFHLSQEKINYDLGHENGVWFNFVTLVAGFIPWSLLMFFSLFGLKLSMPQNLKKSLMSLWNNILTMDKIKLFSLVASACIIFFYSIPSSKRSVYLMPAYPFLAIFISQYIIFLTENRSIVTRFFASFLLVFLSFVILTILLSFFGIIDIFSLAKLFITKEADLEIIKSLFDFSCTTSILDIIIYIFLAIAYSTLCYQLMKKINIKILYATIFLTFCVNMFIDGIIMPQIKNNGSASLFSEKLKKEFQLENQNIYVMNDLRNFSNMYGLNFYMNNRFLDFEKERPTTGYFLSTEKDYLKILEIYKEHYSFIKLDISNRIISDVRSRIILSEFSKN